MFPDRTKPTLFRAGTVPETVPVRYLAQKFKTQFISQIRYEEGVWEHLVWWKARRFGKCQSLLHLSTVSNSKGIFTNIMHISVTILNTDVGVFYVRRSIYRSTGIHGPKEANDEILHIPKWPETSALDDNPGGTNQVHIANVINNTIKRRMFIIHTSSLC